MELPLLTSTPRTCRCCFFEVRLAVVVDLRQQLDSLPSWGLASGTESLCGDVDALSSCAGWSLWSIRSQDTPKLSQKS